MRLYRDRLDKTTRVRWFFVDGLPGQLPYNLFSSANWASEHNAGWDGVGEVWDEPRPWRNGSAPATFPGVSPCGGPLAWAYGVDYPGDSAPVIPPTWVPPCCTGEPVKFGVIQLRLRLSSVSGPLYSSSSLVRLLIAGVYTSAVSYSGSLFLRLKSTSVVTTVSNYAGSLRVRLKATGGYTTFANRSGSLLVRLKATSSTTIAVNRSGSLLVRLKIANAYSFGGPHQSCASLPKGAPVYYVLPAQAFTNSGCTDCANLNVKNNLSWTSGCTWDSPNFTLCGNSSSHWELTKLSGTTWQLQLISGASHTNYRATPATAWDGVSPLVLTLTSAGVGCSGPSTVTLFPRYF